MAQRRGNTATAVARGLGWTSIGIGLAEILAPRQVESLLGLEDSSKHRGLLRVLGVRELMHGVGILTERGPTRQMTAGLWARVAGDVLDTAILGVAAQRTKRPGRFAATSALVAGIGLLDAVCSMRLQQERETQKRRGLRSLVRRLR